MLELLRMFFLQGHELVDRVEELLLDAHLFVEELCGDGFIYDRVHALCAPVVVGDRVADKLVIFIEKDKIDGPGVDADRLRDLPERFQGLEATEDSGPEVVHVPAVMPVLMDLLIVEAEDLFKDDFSVFHAAKDVAA